MISVLLATYNGEKYMRQSLESVLSQTTPLEVLVGFNGTTDRTREIVSEYKDSRIRIFDYGNDKGKARTLNKLLQEASYDWIALQDDDDVWLPNKLDTQTKLLDQFDVIGTFIRYIDENNNFIGGPNLSVFDEHIKYRSLNGDNQVANTSAIFRKSDALEIEGWKEGIEGIEDFDFWLRLIRIGKRFHNIPEYLVYHRLHSKSNFNTQPQDISTIL
jgi:glycosyltransferase EpsE